MKQYLNIIESGFATRYDLDVFLKAIENADDISDRQYYDLRHLAIERFYQ